MSKGARGDIARQAAVVLGAIFQVVAPALSGPAIGRISAENPTLVVPGDYAFVIHRFAASVAEGEVRVERSNEPFVVSR